MKKIRYILLIGAIGLLFLIYKVATFSLFDNELRLIEKLPVSNANYSILIYSFPSSATIEGAIQVHLMQDGTGDSRLFKNYDNYTNITFAKIEIQGALKIGLKDSTKNDGKIDTVTIQLPKSYGP